MLYSVFNELLRLFAAPESPLRANSPFASLPLALNRLRSYFGGDAKQLPQSKSNAF